MSVDDDTERNATAAPTEPTDARGGAPPQMVDKWSASQEIFEKWLERNTKVPDSWKALDLTPENRASLTRRLREICQSKGVTLFRVPTRGSGVPPAGSINVAGKPRVNTGFGDYVDILDPHAIKLKNDEPLAYSHWIWSAVDAERKVLRPAGNDVLVGKALDRTAADNDGLIAEHKFRLRRQAIYVYEILKLLIDPSIFFAIELDKDSFTFAREEDPDGAVDRCGLAAWSRALLYIQPILKTSTDSLNDRLVGLTLEECGCSVAVLLKSMRDLKLKIEAERGTKYDADTYTTMMFNKVTSYTNKDFQSDLRAERRAWENDGKTTEAVEASLIKSYNRLKELGTWDKVEPSKDQVIALATKMAGNMMKKVMARSKKGGSKTDKTTGAGPEAGAGNRTHERKFAPLWQITNKGYHIKHPDTGQTMVWCDKHKSKDGVVNGMYMPAPHNHDEWEAAKKAKREAYRLKVKAYKASKRANGSNTGGSPPKKQNTKGALDKLVLSKSLKAAFCTQLQVSEEDVDAIMEEAVADSLKE